MHTKGRGLDQGPTTSHSFTSIFYLSCHLWINLLEMKRWKTSGAPFWSWLGNNTLTCCGLRVGKTQEKTWKEGVSVYENEKGVIWCNAMRANNIGEEDCCALEDDRMRWFNIKYLLPWGLLQLVRKRQMYRRDKRRKNETQDWAHQMRDTGAERGQSHYCSAS